MLRLLLAAPFAVLAMPAHAATGETVNPWVALAYLVAGVFFILALRGLSSPATSRTGNRFGMIGMPVSLALMVIVSLMTEEPDEETQRMVDAIRVPRGETVTNA